MNTITKLCTTFALVLGLSLAVAPRADAQTNTTFTTLTQAVGSTDQFIYVASLTGITAAGPLNQVTTGLYIDREYMTVSTVATLGTVYQVGVYRVAGPTIGKSHVSGAVVIVGAPTIFEQRAPNFDFSATCVPGAYPSYPIVEVSSGNLARCAGSGTTAAWVVGGPLPASPQPYTAYTTLKYPGAPTGASSTSHVDGTIWFSQIDIPRSSVLTGACVYQGATVTTDKNIVALYDSGGILIASSTLAGSTNDGTASLYQCQAFTAPVLVAGGSYFAAMQTKGTTDNFFTYVTGGAPTLYGTQNQTGTFGTLPAMTTPTTTFTTAKGPLMMVY